MGAAVPNEAALGDFDIKLAPQLVLVSPEKSLRPPSHGGVAELERTGLGLGPVLLRFWGNRLEASSQ